CVNTARSSLGGIVPGGIVPGGIVPGGIVFGGMSSPRIPTHIVGARGQRLPGFSCASSHEPAITFNEPAITPNEQLSLPVHAPTPLSALGSLPHDGLVVPPNLTVR